MKPLARHYVYGMLAVVLLLWTGNTIIGRAVRNDIPPFTLTLGRWTLASAILLPFAWRKIIEDWPVVRAGWWRILLLGLVGVGSFNALLYSGLQHTTATNALLIQASIPALVLAINSALFGLHPPLKEVAGVTIAAVGAVLIICRADPGVLSGLHFGLGDVLVACAALVWAFYTVLLRIRPAIDQTSFITLIFLVGVVVMLPPAMLEWRNHVIPITPAVVGAVVYVAVFASLIAYFLYNLAVREIGPGAASQILSLQPLAGALLAVLLLGEELHGYHLVGMVLILVGIAIPLLNRRT